LSIYRLLGFFAHPDDETFGSGGMLAKYVREGVEVHVCIVTDGAAGSYAPDPNCPDAPRDMVAVRREELECACRVLGVQLHTLSYRDSGMEGSPENHHPESLYQANLDDVTRDVLRLICEIKPQVIVAHDPTGGYFHPDHIRVNHAVNRAWQALTNPSAYPALLPDNCAPWLPDRLYYGVLPRSSLRWMLLFMRLAGKDPRHFGRNRDIDMTQVGVPDNQINVRLDIRPYRTVKQEAGACHCSQGSGPARARGIVGLLFRQAQRYELYMQAYPPNGRKHADLFAGLR
jgi:LmbE family N-acetylglucosaminyl deacetylase